MTTVPKCEKCGGSGEDDTYANVCDLRCDGSHERPDGTALCPRGPEACPACRGTGDAGVPVACECDAGANCGHHDRSCPAAGVPVVVPWGLVQPGDTVVRVIGVLVDDWGKRRIRRWEDNEGEEMVILPAVADLLERLRGNKFTPGVHYATQADAWMREAADLIESLCGNGVPVVLPADIAEHLPELLAWAQQALWEQGRKNAALDAWLEAHP